MPAYRHACPKGGVALNMPDNRLTDSRPQILIPSRYYAYRSGGGRYPLSAMADFAAETGFSGVDLSLDRYDTTDDGLPGMLDAFRRRLTAKGLTLPVCHLPFYMPSPDDADAMRRFAGEQAAALRAAARLGVGIAVVHPIVRHGSRCRGTDGDPADAWLRENTARLSPLRELADSLGVRLAVENMAGRPSPDTPDETVYGSRAEHVAALADALDCGICWDFGHAHITGACRPSDSLRVVGQRLALVHIHDNDGKTDSHSLPGDGSIDWADAMAGLRAAGYSGCMDMELKTSDLPDDRLLRGQHASRALAAARRLCRMRDGHATD